MSQVTGLAFLAAGFTLMMVIVDPLFAVGLMFVIVGVHLCRR